MKTINSNQKHKQIKWRALWLLLLGSSLYSFGQNYDFGVWHHIYQDNVIINADRNPYSANLRLQSGRKAGWNMTNKVQNGASHFEISHGEGAYYANYEETPTTKVMYLFKPGVLTLPQSTSKIGIGEDHPYSRLTIGNAPNNGGHFNVRSFESGNGGWKGAGAFGGNRANVVIGQLNSKAHIGAHNTSLNAYADLIINGGPGNVGVGTNNPTTKLDVNGIVNATGFRVNGQSIGEGSSPWTKIEGTENFVYNNGNIGIGTSNPTSKLHVAGNMKAVNISGINIGAAGVMSASLLVLGSDPNTDNGFYGLDYNDNENNLMIQGGSIGNITFGQRTGSTFYEKARITRDGNLGVGTNNPTEKLEVNGNIKANGIIDATGFTKNGVPFGATASPWTSSEGNINFTTGTVEIGAEGPNTLGTEYLKVNGTANFNNLNALGKIGIGGFNNTDNKLYVNGDLGLSGALKIDNEPVPWQMAADKDNSRKNLTFQTHSTTESNDGGFMVIHTEDEAPVIGNKLGDHYNLFVTQGIVTPDYAITLEDKWEEDIPDYVFDKAYKLTSLEDIAMYVKKHKHLPNVAGINDMKANHNMYNVGDMLMGQLKNLEEQVLHNIAQHKEIETLKKENKELHARLDRLEKLIMKGSTNK